MIDVIQRGTVAYHEVPRLYELNRHVPFNRITIFDYEPNEGLMYFQQYNREAYIDPVKVTVPECRAIGAMGNPYYMANGMRMIDIVGEATEAQSNYLGDAVVEIFNEEFGVEILRDVKTREIMEDIVVDGIITSQGTGEYEDYVNTPKLYFMHNGNKVKFFSPQLNFQGHIAWTYILFDQNLNYNRFLDFYNTESANEWNSDLSAYGIDAIIPNIDVDDVMDKIIDRFIEKMGDNRKNRTLTQEEDAEMARMLSTHTSTDWINEAIRTLPAPYYEHEQEMTKIEVEFPSLASVPATLEFEIETDIGTVREQIPEKNKESLMPDHVQGSHIIYSYEDSRKLITIYKGFVIDANGDKEWCTQDITGNTVTVTLPQTFMQNATYPVTYDPNLGYTTIGGSTVSGANFRHALNVTPTFTALVKHQNLSYLLFQHTFVGTGGEHKMAIYDQDSLTLAYIATSRKTNNVNPAAWTSYLLITIFGTDRLLHPHKSYYLVGWWQSGGYGATVSYDTGVAGDGAAESIGYVVGNGYIGWNTFTPVSNNRLYSIYVTVDDISRDTRFIMRNQATLQMTGDNKIQLK